MTGRIRQVHVHTMRGPDLIPWMVRTVLEKIRSQDVFHAPVTVLVPRSMTLAVELALTSAMPEGGFFDVDVQSPEDFQKDLEQILGKPELIPISELGRSMLIGKNLPELLEKGELDYYKHAVAQVSLPLRVVEILDELEDAGFSPETLLEASRQASPATARKYADLSRIWSHYLASIEGRFEDQPMQWAHMIARLAESEYLRDRHLLICGFDVISSTLTSLVSVASGLAESVSLGLILDESAPDSRIFAATSTSFGRFRVQMSKGGIRIRMHREDGVLQDRHPDLISLEKTLFAPGQPLKLSMDSPVRIHLSPDSYQECLYVAQMLHKWHRSGIAWDDIRITFCEMDTLPSLLPLVLENSGIPVSVHVGQPVLVSDYAVYFLSTIRAVCLGYRKEDMLSLIRSFCAPLTPVESMSLENYAISHGLDRKKWLRPITVDRQKRLSETDLQKLEDCRARVMNELESLHRTLARRNISARQAAAAIYQTMVRSGAYEKLLERGRELLEKNMLLAADQNRQVFDACNDLLNQIALLMGDRHIAMKDLVIMMESAMAGGFIKSVPQRVNSVQISAPGMLLASPARAMVIMGLQDRTSDSQNGLLTPGERQKLSEFVLSPVGLTETEQNARMLQGVYQAVSQATERILMTCSSSKPDGTPLYPGSVFTAVKESLIRSGNEEEPAEDLEPFSATLAMEQIAIRLRAMKEQGGDFLNPLDGSEDPETGMILPTPGTHAWQQALACLFHDPDQRRILEQVLHGLDARPVCPALSQETASVLYRTDSTTISRLEAFASCPYKHFVTYGLRPVPRPDFVFARDAEGNFYHAVLQHYIREGMSRADWPNLTDRDIQTTLDAVIRQERIAWKDGPLEMDEAHRYMGMEYVQNVRRTAWAVTHFLQKSSLVPQGTEVSFGQSDASRGVQQLPPVFLDLPDGRRIALGGIIDRVDVLKAEDGQQYFCVMDYKRSNKELYDADMAYGLQLQLPLYLSAVQAGMPSVIPAGAFYQRVSNPEVDKPDQDENGIEDESLKAMKLQGMQVDIPSVREALKSIASGGGTRGRKTEKVSVSVVSPEEMQERILQAKSKAGSLAERILSGDIHVEPVNGNSQNSCEYCSYRAACGFDERLGNHPIDLKKAARTSSDSP